MPSSPVARDRPLIPQRATAASFPARDHALRLLAEGRRADFALLADVTGLSLKWLMQKADREGWQLNRQSAEDVNARVQAINVAALGRLEALVRAAAKRGGKIDKAEIDAVITLIKGAGAVSDIMRPEEAAKQDQIATDEELATVLQRINSRIVELARGLAAQLVEGQRRGDGRAARTQ